MRRLGDRRLRGVALGALVAGLVAAGTIGYAGAEAAPTASKAATGTLNMNARLGLVSVLGPCPPGVSAANCSARTSRGPFAGLGQVTGTYTLPLTSGRPHAPTAGVRPLPTRFASPLRPRATSSLNSPKGRNASTKYRTWMCENRRRRSRSRGARGSMQVHRAPAPSRGVSGIHRHRLRRARDVDRHPHRPWPRIRCHPPDTRGSEQQDGASQEGCEECPRDLQGHRSGQH